MHRDDDCVCPMPAGSTETGGLGAVSPSGGGAASSEEEAPPRVINVVFGYGSTISKESRARTGDGKNQFMSQ